uniref:MutS_II domain-containing protein n=1 Tax=Macrostomum lignano TaxID=282301 RepID=A0A1I8HYB4_9PLAT
LLRMRCSTETACQLAARRLAWLGEQETPGACQAIEVTVHRVTAYEASLSFGVQADAFYVRSVDSAALPDKLCGVPICAMPEARVFNLLQTEAQLALVLVPPTSKGAVRCSQELRDIFLTNRAHALFCPAGAAGSGQGSRRSARTMATVASWMRLCCAAEKPRFPAALLFERRLLSNSRIKRPHTQDKLKRLINNEISEDQLRREDDWSQLVRSANQFAAAAANSTTSSSSGRGTAQKQQPRCGRCQQLEEQLARQRGGASGAEASAS